VKLVTTIIGVAIACTGTVISTIYNCTSETLVYFVTVAGKVSIITIQIW